MAEPADAPIHEAEPPADGARAAGESSIRAPRPPGWDEPRSLEGMTHEQVIEWACSDQIVRWRRGERVPCEAYFPLHPALGCDGAGVFDLIYSEFALRADLGESPRLEEFDWRFP